MACIVIGLLTVAGGLAAWLGRPAPPLKGVLDVRVWPKGQDHLPGKRLGDEGVLPLKPGDLLRIEATVNRPAYLYVVWLEAGGKATPLWPWADGDWTNSPADRDRPRPTLNLPEDIASAAPLNPGPSGIEALLLLCRDDPLPAGENLSELFATWRPQPGLDPLRTRVAVWFENGEPVTGEPDRAAINVNETRPITDPVWQTRALLHDRLRPLFGYTRAVCFTFQGRLKGRGAP